MDTTIANESTSHQSNHLRSRHRKIAPRASRAAVVSERDQLILRSLPLVQMTARRLRKTLGKSLELDDLVSYGAKGLIEAADRFDPDVGASFETFAYYRIRGAMLDGVRQTGWYSRRDIAAYHAEDKVNALLAEDALGSAAKAGDAGDVEETLASLADTLSRIATVRITSFDFAQSKAEDGLAVSEDALHLTDPTVPSPDDAMRMRELSDRVSAAVAGLPEKERQLVQIYYYSDTTLEEAGSRLGLSKSWASRLHARAVDLLRDALASDHE